MPFFDGDWKGVSLLIDSPCPLQTAGCAESENETWVCWKYIRSDLASNPNTIFKLCQLWFTILKDPPYLDKFFFSTWSTTSAADTEAKFAIGVSCLKWETLSLLSRVILHNLDIFFQTPSDVGNRTRLNDAVACSHRAIKELNDWRNGGNLGNWESEVIPLEIDVGYFQTLADLSTNMFQLFILSQLTGDELLNHTSLLVSILEALSSLSEKEYVPDIFIPNLKHISDAIDLAVSLQVVKSSLEKKKDRPITWQEVIYWQTRVVAVQKPGTFFKSDELIKAEYDMKTIYRIAGTVGLGEAIAPPAPKPLQFQLSFSFPFDGPSIVHI
jgi:hypothetical protein